MQKIVEYLQKLQEAQKIENELKAIAESIVLYYLKEGEKAQLSYLYHSRSYIDNNLLYSFTEDHVSVFFEDKSDGELMLDISFPSKLLGMPEHEWKKELDKSIAKKVKEMEISEKKKKDYNLALEKKTYQRLKKKFGE
ncbi:MAG: hypothetical protein WC511_01915 [Candidatus Pacearchaeota archaeon]